MTLRKLPSLGLAIILASCGAAPAPHVERADQGTAASCVGLSRRAELRIARIVVIGRALPGRTAGAGRLISPAHFRALRYVKGRGPRVIRVQTGWGRAGVRTEDGIDPSIGQRWIIYTTSRRQPYTTSECLGSRRLRTTVAAPHRFARR